MRARRIAAAAALFLSLLLLALPAARAQEESGLAGLLREETERLLGEMDLAPLQEAAPELDVASLLESASQGSAALPVGEILSAAGEALVGNLRSLAPRMVRLVGLAVLSAALLRLRAVTFGDGAARLLQLMTYLCMALPAAADAACRPARRRPGAWSTCLRRCCPRCWRC